MLLDNVLPPTHLWSVFHILYMILVIPLIVVSLILIKKFVKSEKVLTWIMRIAGIVLLILIITNHIDVVRYDVEIEHKTADIFGKETPATWAMVALPFTLCSLSSLLIPFSTFMKKDNWLAHTFYLIAILGGIANIIYPEYLDTQYIYQYRTWSALAHHVLSMWIVLLMLITGFVKPSMRKIHYLPIGLAFTVVLGVFELQVLHYDEAFNIPNPIAKVFYWYLVDLGLILFNFIWVFIFEKFVYKKTLKEIFTFKKPEHEEVK